MGRTWIIEFDDSVADATLLLREITSGGHAKLMEYPENPLGPILAFKESMFGEDWVVVR